MLGELPLTGCCFRSKNLFHLKKKYCFLKCLNCYLFAFGDDEHTQEWFLWLLVELSLIFPQAKKTKLFFPKCFSSGI